jgi:hypothetical protein
MRPVAFAAAICVAVVVLSVHAQDGQRFPGATVKVWDTAVAIAPSISLGLTPGESIDDAAGLTRHGTGSPTIVSAYANITHPRGRAGLAYWNPDANVFTWYGKTLGFPSGITINRSGPVLAGGPVDPGPDGLAGTLDDKPTSFGPGDVWVAGHQLELIYVHIAGTDMFRTYGMTIPIGDVGGKRGWGVAIDEATGFAYLAEPENGRIARIDPVTGRTKIWLFGGNPAYLALDRAGNIYTALSNLDAILRVNRDDTTTVWHVPNANGIAPSFRKVPHVGADAGLPGDNANGMLATDANGDFWFLETNSNEIGRLSRGVDGVLGTSDDQICEFTAPGLLAPQQLALTGTGSTLQVYFTEGDGNSVSVLTAAEADRALSPTRVCSSSPAESFPVSAFEAATTFFDEKVTPLQTVIVPTVHEVAGVGGVASGFTRTVGGQLLPPILRFSPMPNPLLSSDGTPFGDAGNGFPSGLTGVYASNRIAGTYLQGNKHFEVTSDAIVAASIAYTGRMTGAGTTQMTDGTKVTHGFLLHCEPDPKHLDILEVLWENDHRFRLTSVTSRSCSDDPAIESSGFDTHSGTGTGTYDGAAATVTWTFTDAGKPGTSDTAAIQIRDAIGAVVLDISSTLRKGDHRVRASDPQ